MALITGRTKSNSLKTKEDKLEHFGEILKMLVDEVEELREDIKKNNVERLELEKKWGKENEELREKINQLENKIKDVEENRNEIQENKLKEIKKQTRKNVKGDGDCKQQKRKKLPKLQRRERRKKIGKTI